MRDWKPKTGYELRACVACGSRKIRPIFYLLYEGEGFAYQQCLLYECLACGRGIIQRLDYDSFDWESVFAQYEWYILGRPELEKLSQGLKGCRRPASPKCSCAIHRSLRSSLGGLPRSTWEWAFEDDRHVHKVSLEWEDGLPKLTVLGPFSP